MITLMSCWLVTQTATIALAVVVIGIGLISDVIDLGALPFIALLACSGWWVAQKQGHVLTRWLAGMLFIALSIALASHWLPGFHNIRVLNYQAIKSDSVPFSMFINIDKPWIGLVILLSCLPLLKTCQDWQQAFQRVWLPVGLMLLMVFSAALFIGFVRWQPELPQITLLFLLNNLLFTSLSEEVFFRGFIQKSLMEKWQNYHWGAGVAIIVSALIFGLAHFAGGPSYMALSALAGAFYGWSYQRTGAIEMAIFSHWLLNTCHFLFFTYPVATG